MDWQLARVAYSRDLPFRGSLTLLWTVSTHSTKTATLSRGRLQPRAARVVKVMEASQVTMEALQVTTSTKNKESMTCAQCNETGDRTWFSVTQWVHPRGRCIECLGMTCAHCKHHGDASWFNSAEWDKGAGVGKCIDCTGLLCKKCGRRGQPGSSFNLTEWQRGAGVGKCIDCTEPAPEPGANEADPMMGRVTPDLLTSEDDKASSCSGRSGRSGFSSIDDKLSSLDSMDPTLPRPDSELSMHDVPLRADDQPQGPTKPRRERRPADAVSTFRNDDFHQSFKLHMVIYSSAGALIINMSLVSQPCFGGGLVGSIVVCTSLTMSLRVFYQFISNGALVSSVALIATYALFSVIVARLGATSTLQEAMCPLGTHQDVWASLLPTLHAHIAFFELLVGIVMATHGMADRVIAAIAFVHFLLSAVSLICQLVLVRPPDGITFVPGSPHSQQSLTADAASMVESTPVGAAGAYSGGAPYGGVAPTPSARVVVANVIANELVRIFGASATLDRSTYCIGSLMRAPLSTPPLPLVRPPCAPRLVALPLTRDRPPPDDAPQRSTWACGSAICSSTASGATLLPICA